MADATDPLTTSLQAEIGRLNKKLTAALDGARTHKKKAEDLAGQVTTLAGENAELVKIRDRPPTDAERQLRELKHRVAFDKVAADLGVDPEALDDFHALSGYKAEADAPDPEGLKAFVGEALTKRPRFKAQPPAEGEQPPAGDGKPAPPAGPGPGAQRGGGGASNGSARLTRAQVQDPGWMAVPENAKAAASAAKEGRIDW